MSYSYVLYAGNGSTASYAVPFPYISPDHVSVKVGGTDTSAWSFTDPGTILLVTAPAAGASVEVARNTPLASPLADFSDTSTLTETDLKLFETQTIYCVQEARDRVERVLVAANAYTDSVRDAFEPLAGLSPTAIANDLANTRANTAAQGERLDALTMQLSASTMSITASTAASIASEKARAVANEQSLSATITAETSNRVSFDSMLTGRADSAAQAIAALGQQFANYTPLGTFHDNGNGTYYTRIQLGGTVLQVAWGFVGLADANQQAWSFGVPFGGAPIPVAVCTTPGHYVVVQSRNNDSGYAWAYDAAGNISPGVGFHFLVVGIV